jgi:hypothetical protein
MRANDLLFRQGLAKCAICGEIKPIREFIKDNTRKYGFKNKCKVCNKLKCKVFRASNPDYDKEYYLKHAEQIKAYELSHKDRKRAYDHLYRLNHRDQINKQLRFWRLKNPDKVKAIQERSRLKQRHNELS